MAVIDTSWSLTGNNEYDCMRCDFNKEASTNGKRYCGKTGLMLPNNRKNCPLKSPDEMIAEIEDLWHYYPMGHDYEIAINRCLKVIHKYCEGGLADE